MHAAYIHAHAHVHVGMHAYVCDDIDKGPCTCDAHAHTCMYAPTHTHDIHIHHDSKQVMSCYKASLSHTLHNTIIIITNSLHIIMSLTCVPWALLWLRISLLGNHNDYYCIMVHTHVSMDVTTCTYTLHPRCSCCQFSP